MLKKRFYVFYSCHVFTFLTFFYFPYVFKNKKNVENLLSMQAHSEISVLHLTNDLSRVDGVVIFTPRSTNSIELGT